MTTPREVTAETRTDEEIDKIYISALGPWSHRSADVNLMYACTVAHNTHGDFTAAEQAEARVTVATTINARERAGR